jgi:hypothetical protein
MEFVNVRKLAMAHIGPTDATEVTNPPNDTRLIGRGRESFLGSVDLGVPRCAHPIVTSWHRSRFCRVSFDLLELPYHSLTTTTGAAQPSTCGRDQHEGPVKRPWSGSQRLETTSGPSGSAEDCGRSGR